MLLHWWQVRKHLLVAHWWQNLCWTFHEKGMFLKESSPTWRGRFLGGVFEFLEEHCLSKSCWRHFWHQVQVERFCCKVGLWNNEWYAASHPRWVPIPTWEGRRSSQSLGMKGLRLRWLDDGRCILQWWVSGSCLICSPVEGLVQPRLGFRCSLSSLHTNNLSLFC